MQVALIARLARSWTIGLLLLPSLPAPATGQAVRELAAGWTSVGPIPTASGTTYRKGMSLRTLIGGAIAPRFRLGVSGMAVFFERNAPGTEPPCPSPGCSGPTYDKQLTALISAGGNAQFYIDPGGHYFVDAGVGEYATFLQSTDIRPGVSGGAGIAWEPGSKDSTTSTSSRMLATIQVDWHALLGKTSAPRNFIPITVGLRF